MSSFDKRRKEAACGTGFNVRLWCNKDPCGLICAALSWFLVLYAECVVVWVLNVPINVLFCVTTAMLTDPGAVPQSALPLAMADASKEDIARIEEQKYRTCRRCRQFKPGRAHHCSICDRCVIKMDHHCPWVNNCVGLGNHKFFLLFIFYVFILSLYALVLVSLRYARCINDKYVSLPPFLLSGCMDTQLLVYNCRMRTVIFWKQLSEFWRDPRRVPRARGRALRVITTGATQIDRLKGEVADNLGIREVFGGASHRFSLHWLLPVNIWFPTSLKNQILGYVLEEELLCSDDELTEADSFLPDTPDSLSVTMTETLEGGWSVEKRVPSGGSAAEIV
ncbi:Palmitoyltransferase, partial [Globisporangium splendens]